MTTKNQQQIGLLLLGMALLFLLSACQGKIGYGSEAACDPVFYEALVEEAKNSDRIYVSVDVKEETGVSTGVIELYKLWEIARKKDDPSHVMKQFLAKEIIWEKDAFSGTGIRFVDYSQTINPLLFEDGKKVRIACFGKGAIKREVSQKLSPNEKLLLIQRMNERCYLVYTDDESGYLSILSQEHMIKWHLMPKPQEP